MELNSADDKFEGKNENILGKKENNKSSECFLLSLTFSYDIARSNVTTMS